jgi:hypothetical protein
MPCDRHGEHIEFGGSESEHDYTRYYTCDGCLRIIYLKTGRVVGKWKHPEKQVQSEQ